MIRRVSQKRGAFCMVLFIYIWISCKQKWNTHLVSYHISFQLIFIVSQTSSYPIASQPSINSSLTSPYPILFQPIRFQPMQSDQLSYSHITSSYIISHHILSELLLKSHLIYVKSTLPVKQTALFRANHIVWKSNLSMPVVLHTCGSSGPEFQSQPIPIAHGLSIYSLIVLI